MISTIILILLLIALIFCMLYLTYYSIEEKILKIFEKHKNDIYNYINIVISDIVQKEKILLLVLPETEINKNEPDTKKWACGEYIYIKDKKLNEEFNDFYNRTIIFKKSFPHDKRVTDINENDYYYPRILISNELGKYLSVTVKLHELGHHFICVRGEEQNEIKADAYIIEFFNTKLPMFYSYYFRRTLSYYEEICKVKAKKVNSISAYIDFLKFKKQMI